MCIALSAKIFMPNHNHNNNATNSSGYTITIGNCPICLNTFAQAIPHYQHICVDRNTHAKRAAHAATPQHRPVQRFSVQKLKRGKKYSKVASSNTSCLDAHAGFFRLLIKGILDPYAL